MKANCSPPLLLCGSPPLLQTHASNQPPLGERRAASPPAAPSVQSCLLLSYTAMWTSFHLCLRHIAAAPAGRQQRPARESSVFGSAAPPCSNKEIWEIRMWRAFFPLPCYCECALVRTSLRTSAPSPLPNCHSHTNNAARNKSQNKSVAVEKYSAELGLN